MMCELLFHLSGAVDAVDSQFCSSSLGSALADLHPSCTIWLLTAQQKRW